MSEFEDFEVVVRRLRELALRKPLPKEDVDEARKLMVKLKEMGFTNLEISNLTDGGWSESTIKEYTRGVRVENPEVKNKVLSLLTEFLNSGLRLDEVRKAVSAVKEVEARNLTLGEVLELLEWVRKSKFKIDEVIQVFKNVRESGLSLESLKDVLTYKTKLESEGFTVDDLKKVYEASEKFGGFTNVLKSVEAFGGLEGVKAEVGRLSKERSELEENVKALEKRKAEVEHALKTYEEIQARGFNVEGLERLKNVVEKYGSLNDVLEALNTYGSLQSLKTEISKLEKERVSLELKLTQIKTDYAHIQPVIDMCDKLLNQYKLGVSAIERLYGLAKKYGEPLEVFKAVEKYGDLKTLEENVEKLTIKKNELEARVKELESEVRELRGVADELKRFISGVFKPLSDEIGKSVESLRVKFTEVVDGIVSKYNEFLEKFGNLKAEAGKLEEELKIAKVIQALIKYPTELKEIPIDYDILMLKAVKQHCLVNNVNPKVKAKEIKDIILEKGYTGIDRYTAEIELLDLLEWACRGLTSVLKKEVGSEG